MMPVESSLAETTRDDANQIETMTRDDRSPETMMQDDASRETMRDDASRDTTVQVKLRDNGASRVVRRRRE